MSDMFFNKALKDTESSFRTYVGLGNTQQYKFLHESDPEVSLWQKHRGLEVERIYKWAHLRQGQVPA